MDNQYQPPLVPGMNGTGFLSPNYAPTSNPYFTTANQFLPRNLHDVIRWARFITTQSPVTTEVLRKYATYPVTEFVIDSTNQTTKDAYEELYESLSLKPTLHDIGFEYHTIGNVFVSMYMPIERTLKCPTCRQTYVARNSPQFSFKEYKFHGQCANCLYTGPFTHKDSKSSNMNLMNVIKWDPLNIDSNHNPITGEYDYYYKIPNEIKRRVMQGDRLFIDSVPWSFIEAIQNNQNYKFARGKLFHLKNTSSSTLINGVAVPPLVSMFSLVFYQATLRKANESVANDFMAPMRVIYPTAQTGNSDPSVAMSMQNFVGNMTNAIVKHKKDKSHVVIAPVPVGYQAISGEGKGLLVSGEIEQAEDSILLSLGVSRELLTGQTNWTSSTVGLRLLENSLLTYSSQLVRLINWITRQAAEYLSLEVAKVDLSPFKLTDDDSLRQMLMALSQAGSGAPSTLYEAFGLDYEEELRKQREDSVAKAVNDVKTELETKRAVLMAGRALSDEFDKQGDYKQALTKAYAIIQEIQANPEQAQLMLAQLQLEDLGMYALVSHILKEQQEQAAENPEEEEEDDGSGEGSSGGSSSGPPGSSGGSGGSSSSPEKKKPAKKKPAAEKTE